MLVFVLDRHGQPMMPCTEAKARILRKQGKTRCVSQNPYTIQLLHGSSGYKQEVVAGMDTGSQTIGCAAIANGKVLYQSEVAVRQDVSGKMQQRKMYRKLRRSRKRYRPARWRNRASMRRKGRLAPSIKSKVDSHLREKNFVERILPIARWKVELASFDIHKITDPKVTGLGYQNGQQKDYYNTKAYVLARDGHACKSGRKGVKHSHKLHVHHIQFRSQGGSDAPSNLICLCETCHADLHAGLFSLKVRKSKTKHATEIGIIKSAILKSEWDFIPTFGYETKFKREKCLGWDKSHAADAVAIACEDGETVSMLTTVWRKKHISKGDYQQTCGDRSEIRIPTGKLFGLRKFDLIKTPKATGIIKGKRSRGVFVLMNIDGKIIAETSVKKNVVRLSARSTTLIERRAFPTSQANALAEVPCDGLRTPVPRCC